jgi:hypothetical protein
MWPAFPASDYYGLSAPCRRHQSATDLPARPGLAARDRRGPPAGFPRSLLTVRRDRHPAMPLHHRHDYAAGLHHGLPCRRHSPTRKFPARPIDNPAEADRRGVGTGARCDPAHVRQVRGWWVRLRGVQTLVPHVCLSVLLAEPAPSGSTGTPRRCQGCCPPSPPSRGPGCPQLHRAAATARRWWSLTSTRSNSASRRTKSATHSSSVPASDLVAADLEAGAAGRVPVVTTQAPSGA